MIPWWWTLIALVVGNMIGWFFCSLCVVDSDAEENQPRPNNKKGA